MPNHLHAIILIQNPDIDSVETHGNASQKAGIIQNLSNIIRGFKSSVTRECRKSGFNNFAWQGRFYEHVIRNEKSLNKIREYIDNNPIKWELDEYFVQ